MEDDAIIVWRYISDITRIILGQMNDTSSAKSIQNSYHTQLQMMVGIVVGQIQIAMIKIIVKPKIHHKRIYFLTLLFP